MPWKKDDPRRRGELEFHFANESGAVEPKRIKRALERHERRHHQPHH